MIKVSNLTNNGHAHTEQQWISGVECHIFIDTCTEKTTVTESCKAVTLRPKKTQHEQYLTPEIN